MEDFIKSVNAEVVSVEECNGYKILYCIGSNGYFDIYEYPTYWYVK